MGLAFLFSHIIPHLFKKVFAWRGVISDKEPTCQCRRHRWRFNPWVGKIPKGGHGNPLQYFCLENPVDRGAWQATVHGIVKSLTWLKQLSMHVCMKNAEMLSNEKTLESPLDNKEIKLVNPKGNQSWIIHWKDWCWSWISNTLVTWCKELTHLKRPWCWERPRTRGEEADRGWDGWNGFTDSMGRSLSKLQGTVKDREA